jgi:hypothetical protein
LLSREKRKERKEKSCVHLMFIKRKEKRKEKERERENEVFSLLNQTKEE